MAIYRGLLTATALAVMAAATAVHVDGQAAAKPAAPAAKRSIPRLPDGHPDLQGMYDLATLTPVERPAGTPLVMTDEQAAKLEQAVAARKSTQDAPVQADRNAPPQMTPPQQQRSRLSQDREARKRVRATSLSNGPW